MRTDTPVREHADAPRREPSTPVPAPSGPVRTCVGCRGRDGRADLVRVVLDPTTFHVVVDERRAAPGRGGWLHAERACLDLALRRRAFRRAFRLGGDPDATQVSEWMTEHEGTTSGRTVGDTTPSSPGKRVGS